MIVDEKATKKQNRTIDEKLLFRKATGKCIRALHTVTYIA